MKTLNEAARAQVSILIEEFGFAPIFWFLAGQVVARAESQDNLAPRTNSANLLQAAAFIMAREER